MIGATLKIILIAMFAFLAIYLLITSNFHLNKKMFPISFTFLEGLENMDDTKTNEAAAADTFVAALKAGTIKMQDELLITKYRKQYEDAIINMDDYVGFLMLKETLNANLDTEGVLKYANNMNNLRSLKDSLNTTMKFLDNQQ